MPSWGFLFFFLQFIIISFASNMNTGNNAAEQNNSDSSKDWIYSMLLVPLSSLGIFTLYTVLLQHKSPWNALYVTAVSATSVLPSIYTIFLHVRLGTIVRTIGQCLGTQAYLSTAERLLLQRLWMVSGGFLCVGLLPVIYMPMAFFRERKSNAMRVLRYFSGTVLSLGIMGLAAATCITLLLPRSAQTQIFTTNSG